MGNWRTVNIDGSCAAGELEKLRGLLRCEWGDPESGEFGPLSYSDRSPSLFGLNNWPDSVIRATGNLAERDYTVEDVAEHLRKCSEVAPSLSVDVHCGDDWEEQNCVATVRLRDGTVEVLPPQVEAVATPSSSQALGNLFSNLRR